MKSPLKVLLVARHYWPHGSIDSASYLIQLSTGLFRRGIEIEIMTPRFASSWTHELTFREMAVHRPVAAPKSDWSIGRYTKQLTNWIRENGKPYDAMIAGGAREEAAAVMDAARSMATGTVVCVQAGDLDWWDSSRSGRRCEAFCKSADQIVVGNASCQREMLSRGFSPSRIHRIPIGFQPSAIDPTGYKSQARAALASINRDLYAEDDEPVLACAAPMTQKSGIQSLVESARHLVERYPELHIWFIGDGPERHPIYDTLRGDGIRASIAMPGSFGNMEDVFAAADAYVHAIGSSTSSGIQNFLAQAVSWKLPIVAPDHLSIRELFSSRNTADISEPHRSVHWYSPESSKSLRTAIRRVLDDLPASRALSEELHSELLQSRSQGQVIDDYVSVLQRVAGTGSQGPFMGAVS